MINPQELVEAKLYRNEGEVIQDALRYLWQNRPDLRLALAIYRYQTNEAMSLAKAARLAGVSFEQIKDILLSRGIPLRFGPTSLAEAKAEIVAMEEDFG